MARRIVPELISPTQASAMHPAFEAAAEQPPNLRINIKEQAELAKNLLQPGRKVYVDISQESKVNWRKLQKAAGVQKEKPQQKAAPALALPFDTSSAPQASVPRGGGSSLYASVVDRLASGLTMQRPEPDSDDSTSEVEEQQANRGADSEGESDASGHHSDYYENDDGFIDDTEVHEFFGGDWHKPKHSGFYINQGDIEKTDELLLSDDPAPKRKKKMKSKQGKLGSPSQPEVQTEVREVMGKDGKMKKVRRKVKVNADGSPVAQKVMSLKSKSSKENAGSKAHKPSSKPVSAQTTSTAAAATAPQALPGSPEPTQSLPPGGTSKPPSPQTAGFKSLAAAAPQQAALTPEEDKISLAALAGVTPAKAPRALTDSLNASPVAGAGPPGPPAPVRSPLTGKKRAREGTEGGSSYEIPPDIRNLLDQLKAQAEALGLPQEGKDVSEEPSTQGGEEKAPKKLPPQLNPLLAKLARAAARENDIQSGARTVISNAAYSFLHPWSNKGNMAIRLKKLHESAQTRYDKSKEWLVAAMAQQPRVSTGVTNAEAKPIGSDDEFAALPSVTPSHLAAPSTSASGEAAPAAAGSSGLVWDKSQAFALHHYVVSLLELQGGREDNERMWEDIATRSGLWGAQKPSASELKQVYDQNKGLYSQADGEFQPRKRPRKARPLSASGDPTRASGTLDDPNERKPGLSEPLLPPSQPPSESPSLSTQPPVAPPPSNMPAGINTTLNSATSSASQPLQLPPNPAEKPAAPAQIPLQEQQPQLRPLSGAALAATAPSARGSEGLSEARQQSSETHQTVGALQPHAAPTPVTAAAPTAPVSTAGALVAQPSDGLSQVPQPSQGEGGLTAAPPSKHEFLQYGVDNGGDRNTLAQGLGSCRDGSVKDITYKVLLRAGPHGLKVAQILDAACNMSLVAPDWASNRQSRASQISNAMRNTHLFVHVGDHKYAIANFPGVQRVPLKTSQGKQSGEKAAATEDLDTKTSEAPMDTTQLEGGDGSIAKSSSAALERQTSTAAGAAPAAGLASTSNPSVGPIMPLPSWSAGPPIISAMMKETLGQSHLPPATDERDDQGQMQSMQSLLHGSVQR